MQILVFGSTGMLGWYVKEYLNDKCRVVCVNRCDYDVLNDSREKLRKIICESKCDVVINCVKCFEPNMEFDNMVKINTHFPKMVAQICEQLRIHFIHISTNGVFSGSAKNPYIETDIPDTVEWYGITKLFGEPVNATVIRTSIVGSVQTKRAHSTGTYGLLDWVRNNENGEIDGYDYEKWNGVTCLELVKYIGNIINNELYWQGVRHIFSPGTVSKYQLLNNINDVYDLKIKINKVENAERTINLTLDSIYEPDFDFADIHTQLRLQKVFTQMHQKQTGNYNTRTSCRFCANKTVDFLHLGERFGLAGGFLSANDDANEERVYPLTLAVCLECTYMQCKEVVCSDELFKKNYFYYSSMIPSLVEHFKGLADWIASRHPDKSTKIIEMGCNDGVLLHQLKNLGYGFQYGTLVGVDPSHTILSVDKSIETHNEYFNDDLVVKHQFDVFVSCNSFAHIDDMQTIIRNLKRIMNPITGVAIIEVHHSLHIFQELHFDFIYHEHMGYYTVTSLYNICKSNGMALTNVEAIPNHGGSIRCIISMNGSLSENVSESVRHFNEIERPIFDLDYLANFETMVYDWKAEFQILFHNLKNENKTIYGYGASGRANTLMNFAEIEVDMMIDDAPSKIGSRTPVFNIPIRDSSVMYGDTRPDYIIILAWPYAQHIIDKHTEYLRLGGKFIIPLPTLKVI